jgi:hypothetical protein
MPVKDRVVSWYIRNVILPQKEIIDKPGFIITTLSGKHQPIYLRDLFLSENLFEILENVIVERYGNDGRQALYSAGKKFGYVYSSMSNFPTIKDSEDKDLLDFAYFFVRFCEGTYAQQATHDINLEEKTFILHLDDYIICRNNGLGHIMTEGGSAGIWAYEMQNKNFEASQLKCQGRGDKKCLVVCGPEEKLLEQTNKIFVEKNLPDKKYDTLYKTMNEIRPTEYSSNSLQKLLNAGFFTYKRGILSYKDQRFFACDSYVLYFLEEQISKLPGGEQILFNTCFEYGKILMETYGRKDYKKFITDFFPALGFGDIIVLDSDGYKIGIKYFPWTYLSEKSKYIIFRGIMSGIISSAVGERVEFKNFNINIRNYLTLTITS